MLIQALTGFVDAGAAGRLAREHLLASLPNQVLATFDIDALLDYRSRRPSMIFVEDHWESYDEPTLTLHLVRDTPTRPSCCSADRNRTCGGSASSGRSSS